MSGPGARVFFADDPTEPPCISEIATAREVLGPLGDIVGPEVDYLYTKARGPNPNPDPNPTVTLTLTLTITIALT